MTDRTRATGAIIPLDDLEHTKHTHEFVGTDHGDVPFSIILVHSNPASARSCIGIHTEVFVDESGQATFLVGDETVVVEGGHVVVSPPGEAHGFTNTGSGS